MTQDHDREKPRKYRPRKMTREELEALVRWREWALEEARKQLRELDAETS